jgi:uncharacterized protein YndB with AHSA1/START domain
MIDLRHSIAIAQPCNVVYDAVSTPIGMRGWWTHDSNIDEYVGGAAEFGFNNRGMVFRMDVLALERDKRVAMYCTGDHPEWAGTSLEWTLESLEGATLLRFVHADWRVASDVCASCNSMWGHLMFGLKAYAETGSARPQWTA